MSKYFYLFELDNPNATDHDYEIGTGEGEYVIYDPDGKAIARVLELEAAEGLIRHLNRE
jgi:hypothetical protein